MLKAALDYRLNPVCPVNPSAQVLRAGSRGGLELVLPAAPALRVLTKP
jgi:hypothetical protein